MKSSYSIIMFLVASSVVTGCASTSPTAKDIVTKEDGYRQVVHIGWDKTGEVAKSFDDSLIPINQSRVVFIRSNDEADFQTSTNIGIDNRFQVSLQGGQYSEVLTCAGTHALSVINTNAKINDLNINATTFDTQNQTTQYFYVEQENGESSFNKMSKEHALDVLADSDYEKQTHQISRVLAENCVAPVKVEVDKPINLHVEFEFDKATIRPLYNTRFAAVSNFLAEHPDTVASIEGHTDSRGSDAYNQDLSERRAQAVKQELITNYGISAERIVSAKGYGETRPVATNSTEAGRQRNRRVDALITIANK